MKRSKRMPKATISKEPSSIMKMGGEYAGPLATAGKGPRPPAVTTKRPKLAGRRPKSAGEAMPRARAQHARDSTRGKAVPQIMREQKSPTNKPTKKVVPKRKKKIKT